MDISHLDNVHKSHFLRKTIYTFGHGFIPKLQLEGEEPWALHKISKFLLVATFWCLIGNEIGQAWKKISHSKFQTEMKLMLRLC
jgi:hypothetical protein